MRCLGGPAAQQQAQVVEQAHRDRIVPPRPRRAISPSLAARATALPCADAHMGIEFEAREDDQVRAAGASVVVPVDGARRHGLTVALIVGTWTRTPMTWP